MPEKTALIYASVDGHTLKICEKLKQVLLEHDQPVEIINIEDFNGDLSRFWKGCPGSQHPLRST
ncbi:hypothetical protein AB8P51_06385 [Muriicola sp. SD30]|uniref:hypothetical protein n=1 Tax=Muriicola sp. SD30 TaxID=3240936 RepID=UPI0035107310